MSAPTTHKTGDTVRVNLPGYPGRWTVKSIGPKNTVLTPEGGGRGLRCPREYVVADTGAEAAANDFTLPFVHYMLGTLVRVQGREGLYVVIGGRNGKTNVAKLGGDGDRYFRVPTVANITKVDPAEVLK